MATKEKAVYTAHGVKLPIVTERSTFDVSNLPKAEIADASRSEKVCSSSNRSVRLCLMDHPALSRAFHAKRRSKANCEPLSFHCS
jgi:hypothetical protein